MNPAERDALIDHHAEGPARLRVALAKVPPEAMRWRPAPGQWPAHEVVLHCADSETSSYCRIRYLVAEPDPVIVGYDQDRWARELDYHALPIEPALVAIDAVQANTVPLLRRLPEAAWTRSGRHTESGPYGAPDWLWISGEHLELHSRQIEANVAAWRDRGGPIPPL